MQEFTRDVDLIRNQLQQLFNSPELERDEKYRLVARTLNNLGEGTGWQNITPNELKDFDKNTKNHKKS